MNRIATVGKYTFYKGMIMSKRISGYKVPYSKYVLCYMNTEIKSIEFPTFSDFHSRNALDKLVKMCMNGIEKQ